MWERGGGGRREKGLGKEREGSGEREGEKRNRRSPGSKSRCDFPFHLDRYKTFVFFLYFQKGITEMMSTPANKANIYVVYIEIQSRFFFSPPPFRVFSWTRLSYIASGLTKSGLCVQTLSSG